MNREITSENTLKPCPFCGGTVMVTKGLVHAPFYFFMCQNASCHAVISFDNLSANLKPIMALDNWNRRSNND